MIMTLSRQQVTKVLLLMMILQAVHLLITEQPVVEGPLIVVELLVVEKSLVVVDPSAAMELPVVKVLHQEQIP